ncbi:hypothetical protein ACA910_013392 [Epithemia clementina (nom. ined.)]
MSNTYFRDLKEECKIYIAHSGLDKLCYATEIFSYLNDNHVPGVFIDKNMPCGGNPTEQMLHRAVSCRNFWFVVSTNIVKSKWPMRELMIAYARHLNEKPESVCLLIDCLESTPNPAGLWMLAFTQLMSFRLYNANGNEEPFPSNMQRMIGNEGFSARIQRLASLQLASGNSFITIGRAPLNNNDSFDDRNQVLHPRHHTMFPESFRENIIRAGEIRILVTFLNLGFICSELVQALCNGASIKILLLAPDSKLCDARSKALQQSSRYPIWPNPCRDGVMRTLEEVDYIVKEARRRGTESENDPVLEVRFYDSPLSVPIIQADDVILHCFLLHNRTINSSPYVEVSSGHYLFDMLQRELDLVYGISFKRPDPQQIESLVLT